MKIKIKIKKIKKFAVKLDVTDFTELKKDIKKFNLKYFLLEEEYNSDEYIFIGSENNLKNFIKFNWGEDDLKYYYKKIKKVN